MFLRKRKEIQEVPRKRDVTAKELLHKLSAEDLPAEAFEAAWEQFSVMMAHGTYGPKDILHTSIQAFAHRLWELYE